MPDGPKLRCAPLSPALQVCLVAPEIPPNTGAVARTCAATQSRLHLVRPLGFSLDQRAVRRAGLDYWPLVDLHVHDDFGAFEAASGGARLHLFTAGASRSYLDVAYRPGDVLVFGRESVGLDPDLLARFPAQQAAIPTSGPVRSLNLSNAVSIVLYEAQRQLGVLADTHMD